MSPTSEHVEVQLELGHHAYPKTKIGPDEHTHEWTVFVRGPDDCKIHEFIDKVVFNLHDSYPRHRRTFREPPYQVNESGYAGFELPIEIYFKNKDEPKKITYEYDLYLHMNDSVINTRREKLTFQNPSAEFKKKLLKAGGKCHTGPVGRDSSLKSHSKTKSSKAASSPRTPSSHMSSSPAPPESKPRVNGSNGSSKIHHHRVPGKDISSTHSSGPSSSSSSSSSSSKITKDKTVKASAKPDQQFADLFGPPIQTRPSPDSIPSKHKEKSKKHKSHHPEKNHSGERSNSRSSNSSGSTTNGNSNGNYKHSSSSHNNHNSHSSNVNSNSGADCVNEVKTKKSSSSSSSSKSTLLNTSSLNSSSSTSSTSNQVNGDNLKELYWIQKKINELQDPNILQKLVDIIEAHSASFNVTKTTFDFDLLRLDEGTVSKLKEIIQGT